MHAKVCRILALSFRLRSKGDSSSGHLLTLCWSPVSHHPLIREQFQKTHEYWVPSWVWSEFGRQKIGKELDSIIQYLRDFGKITKFSLSVPCVQKE
jgi:hypothetical protein